MRNLPRAAATLTLGAVLGAVTALLLIRWSWSRYDSEAHKELHDG